MTYLKSSNLIFTGGKMVGLRYARPCTLTVQADNATVIIEPDKPRYRSDEYIEVIVMPNEGYELPDIGAYIKSNANVFRVFGSTTFVVNTLGDASITFNVQVIPKAKQ